MASIIDRGKGRPKRWQVKYRTPNPGKASGYDQHSESFVTLAEAKAFRAETEGDVRGGTWIDPRQSAQTFGAFYDEVADTLTRKLRPSSAARLRFAMTGQVLPRWRNVALAGITQPAVQRWIDTMTDDGLAPATVVKAWQTFRKVIAKAVHARMIPGAPYLAKGAVEMPAADWHEARFLTPGEVDRLADAIGERWRAFVYVGALCGLRIGELFGLRWSAVNLSERWVEVSANVAEADGLLHEGAPKTAKGRRRVPLPAVVVDELELHRLTAADPGDGLVFPDDHGRHVRSTNFRNRVWNPACTAAGLGGLVPHELRHTAVAAWIDAGATANEVAARAGHRSVVTILDRYGHRFPAHGERVNDALDAAYRAARGAT